ncbi:hypothetical protein MA612_004549 [Vibrio parahaemolyticus]|uniref:hypothetical protein n=1 Tax=Vibrio parahaemolyticus TaxID=670 RepID=UPI0018699CE3|nr:hypothetical protein [Vibrio parahaemolyticus]EGQ7769571.1 hypothetical protein [Vibrio parahaemolyticus]EIV8670581.1 hypothetical protein [Vibrio parahaemolyticus]MBE4151659.1 hypothetical protein [Vibrio parahaemolyticus]MCR9951687.1 hypothetical protein [Vibrio parahaemolyticus]
MKDIAKLAECFRSAIEISDITEILPFYKYFPKNCCEHTSVFLGFYISLIFPELEIEIIRGRNESIHGLQYHFWLEIDGSVVDLTVDQFKGYDAPIYCENAHPLAAEFVEDRREPIGFYMGHYYRKVLEIERFSKAMSSIGCKLKHVGWEYA